MKVVFGKLVYAAFTP
ncbi:hypothetical protein NB583_19985 [Vibrio parahaemolyticus]|nr:hypothetical protein [Vibrio parahaemolyticus]MCR9990367.1 hypothetical protein [Vibrio parahaemolyticus]MCR9994729.1 hypothetical protein [Vibrio parahaemolyticus]